MNKFGLLPKGLLASCALATALASGFASAAPQFMVDEGVVAGSLDQVVVADRITFGYQATINQTIVGAFDGVGDTFTETGFLNKASYELGGGIAVPSQLNANVLDFGYGIYGIFTITGTAAANGSGGIDATFATATLSLYVDPDQNTTLSLGCGGVCIGAGTDGEDELLSTYTLIVGEAHVFGTLANGDFDSLLNLTLTPFGETFFFDPDPFFNVEQFGGNTENISGASLTESFTAVVDGAGVELFQRVPEPATLSLVGLALLGLGVSTRRRTTRT